MLTQKQKHTWVLGLLLATVFGFSGCKKPQTPVVIVPPPDYPECQPQKCETSGTNHVVILTGKGAEPGVIEACPGDTITWRGQEAGIDGSPFLLYFKENGTRPCINCPVRSEPKGKGRKSKESDDDSVILEQALTHKIASNAPAGCYDYEFALFGKRKIFDPRIIIGQ